MSDTDKPRRYGVWGGNPQGHPEDPTKCIERVIPKEPFGFTHSHQCRKDRGHGPGGLWCKQHDPERIKAVAAAKDAEWRARCKARDDAAAVERAAEARAALCVAACAGVDDAALVPGALAWHREDADRLAAALAELLRVRAGGRIREQVDAALAAHAAGPGQGQAKGA